MYPTTDYNALSFCDSVLVGSKVCDDQHFTCVSCFGPAKVCSPETVLAVRRNANSLEHHETIRKRVRVAVSKVDLVLIVVELYSEAQLKVLSCLNESPLLTGYVFNVEACSGPSLALLLCFPFRVH
jgi:hypothetical protein